MPKVGEFAADESADEQKAQAELQRRQLEAQGGEPAVRAKRVIGHTYVVYSLSQNRYIIKRVAEICDLAFVNRVEQQKREEEDENSDDDGQHSPTSASGSGGELEGRTSEERKATERLARTSFRSPSTSIEGEFSERPRSPQRSPLALSAGQYQSFGRQPTNVSSAEREHKLPSAFDYSLLSELESTEPRINSSWS
jgi:hypothetical protein